MPLRPVLRAGLEGNDGCEIAPGLGGSLTFDRRYGPGSRPTAGRPTDPLVVVQVGGHISF